MVFLWLTCGMALLQQMINSRRTCLGGCHEVPDRKLERSSVVLDAPEVCVEGPASELYNDTDRNPTLSLLGLTAELSQEPICLHQAESDPLSESDIQAATKEHRKGVVA